MQTVPQEKTILELRSNNTTLDNFRCVMRLKEMSGDLPLLIPDEDSAFGINEGRVVLRTRYRTGGVSAVFPKNHIAAISDKSLSHRRGGSILTCPGLR